MNAHFGSRTLKVLWIGSRTDVSERIGSALKDFVISYDQRTPKFSPQTDAASLIVADLLFIEIATSEDLALFEKLASLRKPEQRFVAVTASYDPVVMRQLIRLGLSDWLTVEASAEEIVTACHPLKSASDSKGPRNVIIFMPVLGGMGATTLAIEAAIQLSKGGKESTCLVDLDLYSGECADFLNIAPKLTIDSLAQRSDAIDEHLLESVLAEHPSGIKLLAAQTHMGANQVINASAVLHLLNLISSRFTHVVIDLPRAWQSWTDDVVLGSDAIFLISDGSVPALRAARRQLDEFLKRYAGKVRPKVIINKQDRTWFSTSLRDKDFQSTLGDAFAGTVLDETKLAREAIDRGVPISTLKKNATMIKDLHTIIGKNTC